MKADVLKRVLGEIPLSAEVFQSWLAGDRPPSAGVRLHRLKKALPGWVAAAAGACTPTGPGRIRRVLVVGYLRWWTEYACALGILLAGLGHEVDFGYLPYRNWRDEIQAFDLRRQRAYVRRILEPAGQLLGLHDLSRQSDPSLPADLGRAIEALSKSDVQYTLQRERLRDEPASEDVILYQLRLRRNRSAASSVYRLLQRRGYDVVIVPNGSILEFGAVYQATRHFNVPVVTFEFGEQRERLWLAQDDEVMRQDTSALWDARGDLPLTQAETDALQALLQARRVGRTWANFARRWQAGERGGARAARDQLNLDPDRPVALLCTNVVGDSLALNRQVFTTGMADWLTRTVRHFALRPEAQLVVRVHPGELLGVGHPSAEIVRAALPAMPPHVTVVLPDSKINTYDLIELAHLGLVYTTTTGLEMAMSGVPVVVAGATHYRGKGFTYDPETLEGYFAEIDALLERPVGYRLPSEMVQLAQRYAYRFFFEYPFPFPWHLIGFWKDIEERPLEAVLQEGGSEVQEITVPALLGEPIDWARRTKRDA